MIKKYLSINLDHRFHSQYFPIFFDLASSHIPFYSSLHRFARLLRYDRAATIDFNSVEAIHLKLSVL